jgi:methionyl-tRNA formyltransferase
MRIVIANCNPVHRSLETRLSERYTTLLIHEKHELTAAALEAFQPDYIFFPHWSFIIPGEIYRNYPCVVFHMTDLPYGRGGSPLQNLIVRGHTVTMLSALRVAEGLDTGDIYMKKELSLLGTAEEIFLRAGKLMEQMIAEITEKQLVPVPQQGEPVVFKRRTPGESNVENIETLDQLYDYIRMLDAEGYPHAFIETKHFRFQFTRASLKKNEIIADVRILTK